MLRFYTTSMNMCIFIHNLCLCEGWRRCTMLLWVVTRSWSLCCWRPRQQWISKTIKVKTLADVHRVQVFLKTHCVVAKHTRLAGKQNNPKQDEKKRTAKQIFLPFPAWPIIPSYVRKGSACWRCNKKRSIQCLWEVTDLCAQQTTDNRGGGGGGGGALHVCRTASQVEEELQKSPSRALRFQKEGEEISGQMGDIIPPGRRPTVSTLPVSRAQRVTRIEVHNWQEAPHLISPHGGGGKTTSVLVKMLAGGAFSS